MGGSCSAYIASISAAYWSAITLRLIFNVGVSSPLSIPNGRVDIAWAVDQPAQRLRLTWTERDGPAVEPPARQSFGTRLIETLGRQLKGRVHLTYQPTGFVYAFDVPLGSLTSSAAE